MGVSTYRTALPEAVANVLPSIETLAMKMESLSVEANANANANKAA